MDMLFVRGDGVILVRRCPLRGEWRLTCTSFRGLGITSTNVVIRLGALVKPTLCLWGIAYTAAITGRDFGLGFIGRTCLPRIITTRYPQDAFLHPPCDM
jgi:hypothetical protein